MKKKLFLIALIFCFVLLSLTAKNANQYVSAFLGGKSADYGSSSYYTPAYGVVYTGYFFGEAGAEFQARSGGSSLKTYTPQRYVPSSSAFSSRGSSTEEQPFNTIGLNGRFEYTNATENYYSGSIWDGGGYYSEFHSNYAFAFGAAFRQKIIDNLFAYENCGIEGGPYLLGLYGDFGITYDWYFSVSFGAKVSLGYNFYSASFDYPLMAPYIGIGYAF